MRVSTPYQFESYSSAIRKSQAEYFRVQQQVTTGKKFQYSSEDPLSASLSMSARSLKGRFEQYDKNLRGAKDYTQRGEQSMGEIATVLKQANVLAIQASSSSLDSNALQSLATQITSLQETLVRHANAQGAGGQYIFSGHKTDTKPFTVAAGALAFNGDTNVIRAEVRAGEQMQINLQGADTLVADIYTALEDLKTRVQAGDTINISGVSLEEIQGLHDQVSGVRAELGNKLQTIEALSSENTRRTDDLTKEISDHEEVDLADAFTRYQQAETAYSAALQMASRGMQLSLMDFMR